MGTWFNSVVWSLSKSHKLLESIRVRARHHPPRPVSAWSHNECILLVTFQRMCHPAVHIDWYLNPHFPLYHETNYPPRNTAPESHIYANNAVAVNDRKPSMLANPILPRQNQFRYATCGKEVRSCRKHSVRRDTETPTPNAYDPKLHGSPSRWGSCALKSRYILHQL
jgi:hypothetical protein